MNDIIELMERGATRKAVQAMVTRFSGVPSIIGAINHIKGSLARTHHRTRIGQLSAIDLDVLSKTLERRLEYLQKKKVRDAKKAQKAMHEAPQKTKRLSRGRDKKEDQKQKEDKPKKRRSSRRKISD